MLVKHSFPLRLLCVFGVISCSFLKQKITEIDQNLPEFQMNYYNKMIRKFKGFSVILHRDNETLVHYSVFKNYNLHNYLPKIVLNHDSLKPGTVRPVGQRCLNIAALQNLSKFATYLRHGKNVMGVDVVTFSIGAIDKEKVSDQYWFMMPNLERAGNVVVLQPFFNQCNVYLVCFYCGESSGKLTFWGADRDPDVSVPESALYPRTFNNFRGHLMRVGYIDYYPYFYCFETGNVGNETVCTSPQGSEYNLLQLLANKLNFKYRMIRIENQSYSYLFQLLADGEIDFAIGGLTMTNERVGSLHFSGVIRFEDIVFILNYLPRLKMFAFLSPFSLSMWSVLFIMALAMSYFYKKVTSFLVVKSKNYPWTNFLRGFIEQPVHLIFAQGNRITILVIFFNWWIFVIFVSVAYKSKLSSLLIHSKAQSIGGLNEIVSEGYSIIMDRTGNGTYTELFRTNDTEFYSFRDYVIFRRDLCSALDYMKTHKTVIIGEFSRTILHSDIFCNPFDHNLDLRLPRMPLTQTAHTWYFKAGAPYSKSISKNIKPLVQGGFLNYWQKAITRHREKHALIEQMSHEKQTRVSLRSYISHFCLYSIGIGISSLCFVTEILINRIFDENPN